MKEPSDEYYRAVFGFCSKQSSISFSSGFQYIAAVIRFRVK